jgi:adenine nucleotide transporter 17
MASPAGASPALVESVSGIVGSEVALLVTYPIKTIYTLQALSSGSDGKAQQVASALQIIKRLGLEGLYTGIAPNIVETALSSGELGTCAVWVESVCTFS